MSENEKVLVIDFGSTYNQMLTRSIREMGVYSELKAHTISVEELEKMSSKAIVLSGWPYYVHDAYRYRIENAILELNIPVLGICYGMQLLTDYYGGNVEHTAKRSYEVKKI